MRGSTSCTTRCDVEAPYRKRGENNWVKLNNTFVSEEAPRRYLDVIQHEEGKYEIDLERKLTHSVAFSQR
jgi:hypothetical protein